MGKRADWDPADYPERPFAGTQQEANWRQETSRKFHQLMDNAMMISFFKYGAVADAYPERVHALDSLDIRLKKYAETGNVEYLIDVANFAMIEFMFPANPTAIYKATDVEGSPGRVSQNKEIYDKPHQFRNTDIADKDEVKW
jgi:hypothetical protein